MLHYDNSMEPSEGALLDFRDIFDLNARAVYDNITMQVLSYSDFVRMGSYAITTILDSEGLCLLGTLEHIYE